MNKDVGWAIFCAIVGGFVFGEVGLIVSLIFGGGVDSGGGGVGFLVGGIGGAIGGGVFGGLLVKDRLFGKLGELFFSRDNDPDELYAALQALGIQASISERGRSEERITSWRGKSLGVVWARR